MICTLHKPTRNTDYHLGIAAKIVFQMYIDIHALVTKYTEIKVFQALTITFPFMIYKLNYEQQ